jgi:predicted AlkP superfamily phosphohydrolase/phosphomutase
LLWHRKDLILSCYQKADEFIGQMMHMYPDAMFMIVSDHGFGQPKKYFYVNNALYNAGYLHAKSDPSRNIYTLLNLLFDTFSSLIFHVIPVQQIARSDIGKKIILSSGSGSNIDFTKTKAMYHSVCSRGIRINLKDKYPQGIVKKEEYETLRKEIIDFLHTIKDPDTGKPIVKQIYTKEEVYGDNAVNDPLDIIFDLEEEYGAQELLQPLGGLHGLFSSQHQLELLTEPGFFDWLGDHRPNGIFFAYGANIKNTKVNASIVDIVPTILAAMNLSIPKNIDGKVLTDIFIEPPPVTMIESYPKKKQLLSMAELKKIKKLRTPSHQMNKDRNQQR